MGEICVRNCGSPGQKTHLFFHYSARIIEGIALCKFVSNGKGDFYGFCFFFKYESFLKCCVFLRPCVCAYCGYGILSKGNMVLFRCNITRNATDIINTFTSGSYKLQYALWYGFIKILQLH